MAAISQEPISAEPRAAPLEAAPGGGREAEGPASAYRGQRLFDLALAALTLPVLLPAIPIAGLVVLLRQGRPVLYLSERMRDPHRTFLCIKFRTMTTADTGAASGVLGGHRQTSVTPLGRVLRRSRIDEFPQIWNVIRGDMGFVGPRPPLRRYVRAHPGLYGEVLAVRPGITGLATIIFHAHEERLLARARSPEETERIYAARCIPRKARLDLVYRRRASPALDLYILYLTAARLFPLPGGRRVRRIRPRTRKD